MDVVAGMQADHRELHGEQDDPDGRDEAPGLDEEMLAHVSTC